MSYLFTALSPFTLVPVRILISHANTSALTYRLSHSVLGSFLLINPNPHYYLQAAISQPCNHRCAAARINQHIVWTLINYGLYANGLCPFSAPAPSLSDLHCACTASVNFIVTSVCKMSLTLLDSLYTSRAGTIYCIWVIDFSIALGHASN